MRRSATPASSRGTSVSVPHGSIRVGDVEIVALCDAVVRSSRPIEDSYPLVPADAWPDVRARFPGTVADDGRWVLHVHAFVLRSGGRTVLFDAGIGPASAPAFGWSGTRGSLPSELSAAGVAFGDVDDVLISHVHDDHLGWLVADDLTPAFPNARYVLHAADWEAVQNDDPEDVAIFERTLRPLHEHGVLELSEDRLTITPELRLAHAAGHTPGHQVLVVDSGDARAVVAADTTNHPVLVEHPEWSGTSDADPELATTTRRELLGIAERDALIWIASHLEHPFGRIVAHDGRFRWEPLPVG